MPQQDPARSPLPAGRSGALAVPRPLGEPSRPLAPDHRAGGDTLGDLGAQPGSPGEQGVGETSDAAGILGELDALVIFIIFMPAPDHAAILGYWRLLRCIAPLSRRNDATVHGYQRRYRANSGHHARV